MIDIYAFCISPEAPPDSCFAMGRQGEWWVQYTRALSGKDSTVSGFSRTGL